jgi:ribosome modulation factor
MGDSTGGSGRPKTYSKGKYSNDTETRDSRDQQPYSQSEQRDGWCDGYRHAGSESTSAVGRLEGHVQEQQVSNCGGAAGHRRPGWCDIGDIHRADVSASHEPERSSGSSFGADFCTDRKLGTEDR